MHVDDYTPCRKNEYYFDLGGEVEIASEMGNATLRMKGIGRNIWLMLDGKHTINAIVDQLCIELAISDKKAIKSELISILRMLIKKSAIVANWNPLYKLQLNQELETYE